MNEMINTRKATEQKLASIVAKLKAQDAEAEGEPIDENDDATEYRDALIYLENGAIELTGDVCRDEDGQRASFVRPLDSDECDHEDQTHVAPGDMFIVCDEGEGYYVYGYIIRAKDLAS